MFIERPRPDHVAPANVPHVVALPFPDYDGEDKWLSLPPLTPEAASRWAPDHADLFTSVVLNDRLALELHDADAREHSLRTHKERIRGDEYHQALQVVEEKARELSATVDALESALVAGLDNRMGTRLDSEALNTYLHLAARIAGSRATVRHQQICARCTVVFRRRRRIAHNTYLCGDCHRQRTPRRPMASRYRACMKCDSFFEPGDVQQTSCPACQSRKSTISRHPEVKPPPGTQLRQVTIELPET